jgi:hypothetical protein
MHATFSDVVLDIVQNAVESGANSVTVVIREEKRRIAVKVEDNGRGMDTATLKRVSDPFYSDGTKHPGRTVGLGVPFLLQLVEAVDGTQSITSIPGVGTTVSFAVPCDHVDLPPLGSITEVISAALTFDGDYEMRIVRESYGHSYDIRRSDLREAIGELESVGSRMLLSEFIQSQEMGLHDEGGHDGQNDS